MILGALQLLAQVDAEGGGQVQQIARTFGVDWAHLIAQMISFGVVCILLYRFAYRRVLATLAERRRLIQEALANGEKVKQELASTEAQRTQIMRNVGDQATRLIEEAHAAANRVRDRETQKAISAAEQIITRAQEVTARDREQMMADLKAELGRLVVQASMTVTGKILTPEDQRRLAEEAAQGMAAGPTPATDWGTTR